MPGTETDGHPRRRWLLIVLCIAVAVRAAYFLEVEGDPLTTVVLGDEQLYLDWAERIRHAGWSEGDGTGAGLYHAPGYAWFLAALLATGMSTKGVVVFQMLLGAFTAVLCASTTRALFGVRAGLTAGVIYALFAPALFHESTLTKAAFAQFLVAVALWALVQRRAGGGTKMALLFGLAVGAGSCVQEVVAALIPFAFVLVPTAVTWDRVPVALMALAALFLAFIPWSARNVVAGEYWLPGTTNLGPNLWIGSGAGANGHYRPMVLGRGRAGDEREDARDLAERAVGRELSAFEVSAWWRERAMREMADAPLRTATLAAKKLAYMGAAVEWTDSRAFAAHRPRSYVLRLTGSVLHFGTVAALALAGAIEFRRRREILVPTLGPAALYALALSFFFVFGRLRFAMVPMLLPLAAAAFVQLATRVQGRRSPGPAVGLAAAVWALSVIPSEVEAAPVATTFSNAAARLLDAGRAEEALEFSKSAVAAAPDNPNVIFHHGVTLARLDRFEDAREALGRAAQLDGAFGFRAHLVLAELAAATNDAMSLRSELHLASGFETLVVAELERAASLCRALGAEAAALAFMSRIDELSGRN